MSYSYVLSVPKFFPLSHARVHPRRLNPTRKYNRMDSPSSSIHHPKCPCRVMLLYSRIYHELLELDALSTEHSIGERVEKLRKTLEERPYLTPEERGQLNKASTLVCSSCGHTLSTSGALRWYVLTSKDDSHQNLRESFTEMNVGRIPQARALDQAY
jgi:hypothetical protein